MSDVIVFNDVQIGDRGCLLVPRVEALAHAEQPMLWSTFAEVDDSSRNWVYRIRAAIAVERNEAWKVIDYVASLREALGGVKASLLWKIGGVARVTWPDARLDLIRPARRADCRLAGFEANVVLEFTCASDPL